MIVVFSSERHLSCILCYCWELFIWISCSTYIFNLHDNSNCISPLTPQMFHHLISTCQQVSQHELYCAGWISLLCNLCNDAFFIFIPYSPLPFQIGLDEIQSRSLILLFISSSAGVTPAVEYGVVPLLKNCCKLMLHSKVHSITSFCNASFTT